MPRRRLRTEPRQEELQERRALDDLFAAAYAELRQLASRRVKRGDASVTLSPTGLVHEAWLKLASSPHLGATSPLHFRSIAARAMRQVLVEAVRRRLSGKRSGGAGVIVVAFDDSVEQPMTKEEDVLALDDALQDLAGLDPGQARLVEDQFFGGFTIAELAELRGISKATVDRDLRAARAWLKTQLRRR